MTGKHINVKSIYNSVRVGLGYLEKSCKETGLQNDCIGTSRSTLNTTKHAEDIFCSLMALDLLGTSLSQQTKKKLYEFVLPKHIYFPINYYKFERLIPDDAENSSLLHYLLKREGYLVNKEKLLGLCRLISLNTNKEGHIQVYFPPRPNREDRVDPCCGTNAMRILYASGNDWKLEANEDFLYSFLAEERFLAGTRYYSSPDTFLFFLARTTSLNERAKGRFHAVIHDKLKQRIGSSNFPLDLAMRILTIEDLGLAKCTEMRRRIESDVMALLEHQCKESGSFTKDSLWKMGSADTFFGGEVISTIFGVAALRSYLLGCSAENIHHLITE